MEEEKGESLNYGKPEAGDLGLGSLEGSMDGVPLANGEAGFESTEMSNMILPPESSQQLMEGSVAGYGQGPGGPEGPYVDEPRPDNGGWDENNEEDVKLPGVDDLPLFANQKLVK